MYMSSDCYNRNLFTVPNYKYTKQDCTWDLRFNKQTHELQKGEFTSTVQGRAGMSRAAQTTDFWSPQDDKPLKSGIFTPTVEKRVRMELLVLRGQGLNCTFGGYADGCWSGSGGITLNTSKDDGTKAVEVIGSSISEENEETFLTLTQIALRAVDRSEWKEQVKAGIEQLKVKYRGAVRSSLFNFGLYHHDEVYSVHLVVMDRQFFKLLGMAMVMKAGLKSEDYQIPDCMYWVLSVRPRR